jgi:SAM-dependent methyltransferase
MTGRYANTPATARFLVRNAPSYVGGILEMANARLYPFWADLTLALKSGKPQNEVKLTGRPLFDELYRNPARLEQFLEAMAGIQIGNFTALATQFNFSRFSTLADVGGANGLLASTVAKHHPHIRCTSYDLPPVVPIALRKIAERGLADRVGAQSIDFFKDEFPNADVITMGNVLHDWNLETKRMLIAKAFRALPPGGVLVAVENVIDDERRANAFGLIMSLNMLIETGDGFDYTSADFSSWCHEVGFARCEVMPLVGPASAAIAWK